MNIGLNYILPLLIEINYFVTTEGCEEYSDYLRQISGKGSPDLPRCTTKRLALKMFYRQLQDPHVVFRFDRKS